MQNKLQTSHHTRVLHTLKIGRTNFKSNYCWLYNSLAFLLILIIFNILHNYCMIFFPFFPFEWKINRFWAYTLLLKLATEFLLKLFIQNKNSPLIILHNCITITLFSRIICHNITPSKIQWKFPLFSSKWRIHKYMCVSPAQSTTIERNYLFNSLIFVSLAFLLIKLYPERIAFSFTVYTMSLYIHSTHTPFQVNDKLYDICSLFASVQKESFVL